MLLNPESHAGGFLVPRELLRWVYLGRITLVSSILAAALFVWQRRRWDHSGTPTSRVTIPG
jgi:hypothetical protein